MIPLMPTPLYLFNLQFEQHGTHSMCRLRNFQETFLSGGGHSRSESSVRPVRSGVRSGVGGAVAGGRGRWWGVGFGGSRTRGSWGFGGGGSGEVMAISAAAPGL